MNSFKLDGRMSLALGIFEGPGRIVERMEALLRRGREFAPRVSKARLAVVSGALVALTGLAALSPRWIAYAQTPEFEAASIRKAGPFPADGRFAIGAQFGTGRFEGQFATLAYLLASAYSLPRRDQIVGPTWITQDYFSISAKASEAVPVATMKLMLQRLLAERFHIVSHVEERKTPMYDLVVGPQGPKLEPAEPDCKQYTGPRPDGIETTCLTLDALTAVWTAMPTGIDRPVVNRTGLTGPYKISLRFSTARPGVPPAADDPNASLPDLRTAIRDVGLRLDLVEGTFPRLVVESASRTPEDN